METQVTADITKQCRIVRDCFMVTGVGFVRTKDAEVHTCPPLAILLDMLIEAGLLTATVKQRRQGARGRRSARNYLLRQALWFARTKGYWSYL